MKRSVYIALFFTGAISLSMFALNVLTSIRYPWCIFPIFGVLWWPLSAYFIGRKQPFLYALCGAGLVTLLFLLTYLFFTPGAHPWFLYPMVAIGWWPLSVWGYKAGARKFSVTATEYIVLMMLIINIITSPGYWWWLYPAIFVIWWPLAVHLYFKSKEKKNEDPE